MRERNQTSTGTIGADLEADIRSQRVESEPIRTTADRASAAPLDYNGQNLTGMDFTGADLRGADFSGTTLCKARFFKALLDGASLQGADLGGAEFAGASLRGARMEEVAGQGAGFGGADLREAALFGADLRDAGLSEADLSGADLRTARLDGARLRSTRLVGTDLTGAGLAGADLAMCDVDGASFNNADLREARLRVVRNFKTAQWYGVDVHNINFAGAYRVRRHIIDENFLKEFRESGRWARVMYELWRVTSDCGRSMLRWMICVTVASYVFACLYVFVDVDYGAHQTVLSPWYYSVVTLTTLGYGDVCPVSTAAKLIAMIEVGVGYLVLGGLISILANKIARRGD